jgi:hypothetical protein
MTYAYSSRGWNDGLNFDDWAKVTRSQRSPKNVLCYPPLEVCRCKPWSKMEKQVRIALSLIERF